MIVAVRHAAERRKDALKWLAIARQADPDPEVAVVYQQGLADIEPDVLEAVCHRLGREPRREFEASLPTVGAIREACAAFARARVQAPALPAAVVDDDRRTYRCALCQDDPAGLRLLQCPAVPCGREREHPPHPYAARCRCWFWRHGEAVRLSVQQAREKGKAITVGMRDVLAFDEGNYPWAQQPLREGDA